MKKKFKDQSEEIVKILSETGSGKQSLLAIDKYFRYYRKNNYQNVDSLCEVYVGEKKDSEKVKIYLD